MLVGRWTLHVANRWHAWLLCTASPVASSIIHPPSVLDNSLYLPSECTQLLWHDCLWSFAANRCKAQIDGNDAAAHDAYGDHERDIGFARLRCATNEWRSPRSVTRRPLYVCPLPGGRPERSAPFRLTDRYQCIEHIRAQLWNSTFSFAVSGHQSINSYTKSTIGSYKATIKSYTPTLPPLLTDEDCFFSSQPNIPRGIALNASPKTCLLVDIMELGDLLQLLLAVIASLIALFGIWMAWRTSRGM